MARLPVDRGRHLRRLAVRVAQACHQVAAVVQPGGHSFPLAEHAQGSRRDDPGRKAFLTVRRAACAATLSWPTRRSQGNGRPRPGIARLTRRACYQAMCPRGVGGAGEAAAWCCPADGGRSGTGLWDHGIRLGVGRALHRQRLPVRPLRGPERHVDRRLQLSGRAPDRRFGAAYNSCSMIASATQITLSCTPPGDSMRPALCGTGAF